MMIKTKYSGAMALGVHGIYKKEISIELENITTGNNINTKLYMNVFDRHFEGIFCKVSAR